MGFYVALPVSADAVRQVGYEKLLDDLSLARVDSIILNAQEPSGAYYRFHDEQYAFTRLKNFHPSYATDDDKDMLGILAEKAAKRGMGVYSHTMSYDTPSAGGWPRNDTDTMIGHLLPNYTDCSEIDIFGRRTNNACLHNPDYRQFYISAVRDQLLHYPIEGINFNIERFGPISTVMIGTYASNLRYRKPKAPVCFCPHCIQKAHERGIDVHRAKAGYMELLEFSERSWRHGKKNGDSYAGPGIQLCNGTADDTPADGYMVEFMRILYKYPEILAWNTMWYDGLLSLYAELYSAVHSCKKDAKLGLHIWHHRSLCLFERASYDYADIRRYADWIKPKLDPTCAGYRYANNVKRWHQAIAYDMDLDVFYKAFSQALGFRNEVPLEKLSKEGLSFESLKYETACAVKAVRGEVPIYPGVGLNMPAPDRPTKPEYVKKGLRAIFEGGAEGTVLSRGYSEMSRENLIAAGEEIDAIRSEIAKK